MRPLLFLISILVAGLARAQSRDSTITTIDSLSGEKKIVLYTYSGVNYSIDGIKGPKRIKRNISKYDKQGKLVYKSDYAFEFQGCIRHTLQWEILAYDKSGAYHTLRMRKKGFRVEGFDKNGKRTVKKDSKYFQYEKWMDAEEERP